MCSQDIPLEILANRNDRETENLGQGQAKGTALLGKTCPCAPHPGPPIRHSHDSARPVKSMGTHSAWASQRDVQDGAVDRYHRPDLLMMHAISCLRSRVGLTCAACMQNFLETLAAIAHRDCIQEASP